MFIYIFWMLFWLSTHNLPRERKKVMHPDLTDFRGACMWNFACVQYDSDTVVETEKGKNGGKRQKKGGVEEPKS